MKITYFFTICITVIITNVNGEIFSSMDQLIQMPQTEAQVTRNLRSILNTQYEKLADAKKILDEFESLSKESNRDPKKFLGNPVNSFLMIKSLTLDLEKFFRTLKSTQELNETWHQIHDEKRLMPTENDFKETAVALNRIEDTYKLSPEEITKGVFGKSHSIRHLNALDCFELGKISQEKGDHYHAIRWFNEAAKLTQSEANKTVDEILISIYISKSTFLQGNVYQAFEWTKQFLTIDPKNMELKKDLEIYKRELADLIADRIEDTDDLKKVNLSDFKGFKNERGILNLEGREIYESLCRDDYPYKITRRINRLKCRLINHHPLLRIAPVKQEQVFDDPPIYVFYDVISQNRVDNLINISRSDLKRAKIGTKRIAGSRISQNGWLNDSAAEYLPYMTSLVGAVTNLSMTTSENWQMNNYGLGGFYDIHFDYLEVKTALIIHRLKEYLTIVVLKDNLTTVEENGNRIATWMFYLEAPEMGGATVFPEIAVHVRPVSRSAVFWYNLLPSGERDLRTLHAACPVLVGSKWVANKWIRSKEQAFKRPCDLDLEDSIFSDYEVEDLIEEIDK